MTMSGAKIRTLVVDDEPVARARVLSLLRDESDIEVIGECESGPQAISAIESTSPDLVFLDIQMPQMDGVALARTLGEAMPAVVFVTAYDEYALRAFEVHALDYLLKPFSAERFKSALMHARQHLSQRRATGARDAAAPERRDRLVIKLSGRIYFVRTQEIELSPYAASYTFVFRDGAVYQAPPLQSTEPLLSVERVPRATVIAGAEKSTAVTAVS